MVRGGSFVAGFAVTRTDREAAIKSFTPGAYSCEQRGTGAYENNITQICMASQPITFRYTPDQIAALELTISPERLSTYVGVAGGDKALAILLYERNILLSEGLYGVLQRLEVALRNAFHDAVAAGLGRRDWYDYAPFSAAESEAVTAAKRKLTQNSKPCTPGRVVAELSFGFWTALTHKRYARQFWDVHLYKAFPHRRMSHKTAFARLDSLRRLRNRVAHLEPILGRNLHQDLAEIVETMGWICPTSAVWLEQTNTLKEKLAIPLPTAANAAALTGGVPDESAGNSAES